MKKSSVMWFPWLLVCYEISIYLSMDAYLPAFTRIANDFSVNAHMVQLTALSWFVGGFVFQVLIGPISDRYGRRPILLWGGVLYVVSSVACAMAPNIHFLIVARLFQGMSMPTMYIAGYAAVNEMFDSTEAIKILARLNSVTILAPAFGPLLGGALLLWMPWHGIFLLLAAISALALILLYFVMPETLSPQNRSTRLHLGDALRAYTTVISNSRFMSYALIAFLPLVGLIAWMLAGAFMVITHFHYTTLDFGLIQTALFSGFILGNRLTSQFINPHRQQRFINVGYTLILSGATLSVCFCLLMPDALFLFLACFWLVELGVGLCIPVLSRLTLEASDAMMGVKVTVFSVMRMGSGFLGSILITYFYNATLLRIALIIAVFPLLALLFKVCMTSRFTAQPK